MKKIKLFSLLSIVGCLLLSGLTFENKSEANKANAIDTPDVKFIGMAGGWDNAHYESAPGLSCNVLAFDKNLGDAKDGTNQANANYEIGTGLTLNGVYAKDIPSIQINYAHGFNYLYVIIPDSLLVPTDEYPYATLHIASGTRFMNRFLPELDLYLVNTAASGETPTYYWKECTFKEINAYWNNIDLGHNIPKDTNNIPTEGFSALISFSINLRANNTPVYTNMATSDYEIGRNIYVCGTRICDMPGSIVDYIVANNHLYFYFREDALSFVGASQHIILEIKEGTKFLDVTLPSIKIVCTRGIGKIHTWEVYNEPNKTQRTLTGIEWNNAAYSPFDEYPYGLLLRYDNNLSSFPYENGTSSISLSSYNYAKTDIGTYISYNNKSLSKIDGAVIRYFYGGFLFIFVPGMNAVPTERNSSIISIADNSPFLDALLPQTFLVLKKGQSTWQTIDTLIKTYAKPTLKSMNGVDYNGLCFTSLILLDYYNTIANKEISFGTFIIDESSYKKSGYSTILEYVCHVSPSNKTYIDVPNGKKDFISGLNADVDGYISYSGSIVDIKPANYGRKFIGTGYIIIDGVMSIMNESGVGYDFYSTALEANELGTLPNASRYLNYGIVLSETNKTYELVTNTNVSNSYGFTYLSNGYYQVTASTPKTVIKVGNSVTRCNLAVSESKVISFYNNKLHFVNSCTTKSGIAEPVKEIWNDGNTSDYSSIDNITDLCGAFNCKTQRIWLNVSEMVIADLDRKVPYLGLMTYDNQLILNNTYMSKVHSTIKKYRDQGVEEIILMINGFVRKWTDTLYLLTDNTYAYHLHYDNMNFKALANVIPDRQIDDVTKEDLTTYNSFIDTQRDFYTLLAKEFEDADVFETFNEIDVGGNSAFIMEYRVTGETATLDRCAKHAMDLTKALTDAVKNAGTNHRVISSAIGCIDAIEDHPTRVFNSKNFVTECYKYIASNGDIPKNYFQALNIHPYVFASMSDSGTDSNYLYTTTPKYNTLSSKRYQPDNTDYDTDWGNYCDALRTIMSGYNDSTYTPFYITEFGFTDYGVDSPNTAYKTTDSSWKNLPSSLGATVLTKISNVIKNKGYFHSVLYFRMLDHDPLDSSGNINLSKHYCTESNFGLIDELYDGGMYLKQTGQAVYKILNNGSTDYSKVNASIARMIERGTFNA